ncbi:hypothetical protein SDC9_52126 [bioreactor metagenome]|uniref:Uncharacterized protein n=1 Tax=bioreactor metagenome TaxID=1076179 RepID=A0A644WQM8_9ZZZZ
MKKILIIFIVIGLTACGGSKKEEKSTTDSTKTKEETLKVPDVVKDAFAKAYPNVADAVWGEENGNFEAEFTLENAETSVVYSASGSLLETETVIDPSKLPEAAKKYCAEKMAGKDIKEAVKKVDAYGVVLFGAEIDGKDYLFDDKGEFRGEMQEKGDNKNDD